MESDNRPESFHLLFVCSGNTCRSPLAQALAERELAALGWRVEVRSAGIGAIPGEPASAGSVRAASRHGLDLDAHLSRPVDDELVRWADLILVMSATHLVGLARLGVGGKAALLDAFARGEQGDAEEGVDVPDPFGGDDQDYEDVYVMLEELIPGVLRRLEPILAP